MPRMMMESIERFSSLAKRFVTQLLKAVVAPASERICVTTPMDSVNTMTHMFPGSLLVSARKL